MKFTIDKIIVDKNTINYQYSYDAKLAKYFNKNISFFVQYDQDVSNVPESILIIPILANIMPISWFAGFDVYIDSIDENFARSLQIIKSHFEKDYPFLKKLSSTLHFQKLINNKTDGIGQSAMLFSGGVDAFATFFRHNNELPPDLITIFGADIELDDNKQIQYVIDFNQNIKNVYGNNYFTLKSNLRDFYHKSIDNLLPYSNQTWWGNIQHGLALLSLTAPVAFVNHYTTIYIASSYSSFNEYYSWGSMPEIDNNIHFSETKCIHDGFEMKRQDKVDLIVANFKELGGTSPLRVCYSELSNGNNCNICEKCLRTIAGIMFAGGDPRNFGFKIDISIYERLKKLLNKGFTSKGTAIFWGEIYEKSLSNNDNFFYFENKELEKKLISEIQELLAKQLQTAIVSQRPGLIKMAKRIIINNHPQLFKKYLIIRRRFL